MTRCPTTTPGPARLAPHPPQGPRHHVTRRFTPRSPSAEGAGPAPHQRGRASSTRAPPPAARPRACGSPETAARERLSLTTTGEPDRRTKPETERTTSDVAQQEDPLVSPGSSAHPRLGFPSPDPTCRLAPLRRPSQGAGSAASRAPRRRAAPAGSSGHPGERLQPEAAPHGGGKRPQQPAPPQHGSPHAGRRAPTPRPAPPRHGAQRLASGGDAPLSLLAHPAVSRAARAQCLPLRPEAAAAGGPSPLLWRRSGPGWTAPAAAGACARPWGPPRGPAVLRGAAAVAVAFRPRRAQPRAPPLPCRSPVWRFGCVDENVGAGGGAASPPRSPFAVILSVSRGRCEPRGGTGGGIGGRGGTRARVTGAERGRCRVSPHRVSRFKPCVPL